MMDKMRDLEWDATGGGPLPSPHRPGITILVAEGDPAVRSFLKSVLAQQEYRVLEAADGKEALRLAEAVYPKIDILLTDFALPALNGIELAMAVREAAPHVGIVLMSGILQGSGPGVAYLQKPFTATALLTILSKCLQNPGTAGA
jgi:DNA-binding response OmpR family regulator